MFPVGLLLSKKDLGLKRTLQFPKKHSSNYQKPKIAHLTTPQLHHVEVEQQNVVCAPLYKTLPDMNSHCCL